MRLALLLVSTPVKKSLILIVIGFEIGWKKLKLKDEGREI